MAEMMNVDQEEQYFKVKVHCIGVFVPCDSVGPSLMMMERTGSCSIYCVTLSKETSDLVSPLFEHTLSLCKGSTQGSLTGFKLQSVFTMRERHGCHARLDAQYTHAVLSKKLKELIGRTLFVEIDSSHCSDAVADPLLNPYFAAGGSFNIRYAFLDCVNREQDGNLLENYLEIYNETSEKTYRGRKTLYENFWKEVELKRATHYTASNRAVDQLLKGHHQKNTLYNTVSLMRLFRAWSEYKSISGYFRYRLETMEHAFQLYKMLKPSPLLLARQWEMTCHARMTLYNFCEFLRRLIITVSSGKPVEIADKDIPLTLFDNVLQGQLYNLLALLIDQHFPEEERDSLTRTIKYPLIVQCLILKLSALGKLRGEANKATLEAIVLNTIYTTYLSFIVPPGEPKSQLPHAVIFDLASDEEDISAEHTDFHRTLILYYSETKKMIESQKKGSEQWLPKQRDGTIVTLQSPIFFCCANPEVLAQEEINTRLCDKSIVGRNFTRFYMKPALKPITEDAWRDDWSEFKESAGSEKQQYSFVLFTPSELKKNDDLECIKTMLFSDLHNTVILRQKDDVFFNKRISLFFSELHKELTIARFHTEHCYEVSDFYALPKEAVRETIIIPQCHTLSLKAMEYLLCLAIHYRKTIKRIVLIGATSLIPVNSYGQGFLDLLRFLSPKEISPPLYNKEERTQEFTHLLSKYWRLIKYESPNMLSTARQQTTHFKEGKYCTLYDVKKPELLLDLFPRYSTTLYTLYCLYKVNPTSRANVKNALFAVMSAKHKACKTVVSMEIDELERHDCIGQENALFVISKKTILSLDKNQYLYLFTLLDCLYIVEHEEEDNKKTKTKGGMMDALVDAFRDRKRPNLRYSHFVLDKKGK